MKRRVIKVGGSLLQRADLADQLKIWIKQQTVAENFFIVGGGIIVDAIRALDQMHRLEPCQTHWMCVDLLDVTYQIARNWFADWTHVETRNQLHHVINRPVTAMNHLVATKSFYHQDDDAGFPQGWQTTSDSISARLAIVVDADEIVLLKSTNVDRNETISSLVTAGIIDPVFPDAAKSIANVRIEKLAL